MVARDDISLDLVVDSLDNSKPLPAAAEVELEVIEGLDTDTIKADQHVKLEIVPDSKTIPPPIPDQSFAWQQTNTLSYKQLKKIQRQHNKILKKRYSEEQREAAKLHALRYVPITQPDNAYALAEILRQSRELGIMDGLDVKALNLSHDARVQFSRFNDKPSGKIYQDRGFNLESVRILPSGHRISTFYSHFEDKDMWVKAVKGQEFFHGLVQYAKNEIQDPILAQKLAKAAPLKPVIKKKGYLANVLVDGTDVQDSFASATVDEKVKTLAELTDIDLITSYFSRSYLKTADGKKANRTGVFREPVFRSLDDRAMVCQDILLRVDKRTRKKLEQENYISDGEILRPKQFSVLYEEGDMADALRLIGLTENTRKHQQFFTPFDLQVGNAVKRSNGTYSYLDFECSRMDSIMSVIFKRWAMSGLYNHDGSAKTMANGRSSESVLMNSAYQTLTSLQREEQDPVIYRETFNKQFQTYKKIELLRNARRYAAYEGKDKDPEKLRAAKRFFYTLFTKEVAKDADPDVLKRGRQYLDRLFEAPLTDEEMKSVEAKYDPAFFKGDEINPADVMSIDDKLDDIIGNHKKQRRFKLGLLAIPAAIIGGLYLGILAKDNSLAEKNEEVRRAKIELQIKKDVHKYDRWEPVLLDAFKDRRFKTKSSEFKDYDVYRKVFKDDKTAAVACANLDSVLTSAVKAGIQIDFNHLRTIIAKGRYDEGPRIGYAEIEPHLKEVNFDLWHKAYVASIPESNHFPFTGATPEERKRKYLSELVSRFHMAHEAAQRIAADPNLEAVCLKYNEWEKACVKLVVVPKDRKLEAKCVYWSRDDVGCTEYKLVPKPKPTGKQCPGIQTAMFGEIPDTDCVVLDYGPGVDIAERKKYLACTPGIVPGVGVLDNCVHIDADEIAHIPDDDSGITVNESVLRKLRGGTVY